MAFIDQGTTITPYFSTYCAKITDWSSYTALGGAMGMGNNSYRQLGVNTLTHYSSPVTVTVQYNWSEASFLRSSTGTLAINQDNKLFGT